MHLLYVDDDRINLLLFEATCHGVDGVSVATAVDGDEALRCAAQQPPDLVVIDLHLVGSDGFSVLDALRAGGLRNVPAVLCSADDDPALQAQAQAAGFAACWTKPVERPALLTALDALARPPGR
jgi:CheY-like chemotaxis protein